MSTYSNHSSQGQTSSSRPSSSSRQTRPSSNDTHSRQQRESSTTRQPDNRTKLSTSRSDGLHPEHYDGTQPHESQRSVNPIQNPQGKPPSGSNRHSGVSTGSGRNHGGSTSSRHSGNKVPQEITNPRQGKPSSNSRRPGGSTSSQSSGGSPSLVGSGISMTPSGSQRYYSGPPATHGVSMRPQGGNTNRPSSGQRSSNNSASLQDVDLNLSHGSENSVVTLGGIEYPVGSRIGKSGMFVIGDPAGYGKHDDSRSTYRSSVDPSIAGSQGAMYRGDGKGYNFEYWNWSIIRFVCFIFICLLKVGLLAGIIAVAVEHKKKCTAHFLWWQGSTFYNIPVPYFYDTDNSKVGDILGIEKKHGYFEQMGYGAVILQDFLWSEANDWSLVASFTTIDDRLGTASGFRSMVETLHNHDLRVVLRMCPWYTSTEHSWYIESRESSANKFKDFYVWRDAPERTTDGKWEFNVVRNQYYFHRDDISKPVLDWTNPEVVSTFEEVLNFWLRYGVDGFVLCEVDKFYVTNETQIMSILGRFHKLLSDKSQGEDSKKILVVDSTFVKDQTSKVEPQMLLERIDLIEVPLILTEDNKTLGLQALINSSLKYEANFDLDPRPWILWSLDHLKDLPAMNLGALQLLNLMLPGTPSYTAGQELALFYLENDDGYQAPMIWQSEGVAPYNPGGLLPEHNLEALRNVSTARQKTFSLRLDKIPDTNHLNYYILETDSEKDFFIFSRNFTSDNTYYYAVNFGSDNVNKDLAQMITPWATVLADSSAKYDGRLELRDVVLEAGQAIVFYPTK